LTDDITNIEAARARLRALREQHLAERIEAGEIVSVPVFVVVGTASAADAAVEQAKADKLAELHAAGETREVVFATTIVITGVCKHGEATVSGEPWKPTVPPFFPGPSSVAARPSEEEAVREAPQPPLIETYIAVQTRRCRDDDDPGEICEGYFSIEGKVVTVTDAKGRYVGSRALLKGEDARVVAKRLLREKTPEAESFNRRLNYPNAGLA
jgi:hypothetical protein